MSLWEKVSFVSQSKNRKKVVDSLDKPTTPTVLAKKLSLHRSVVSRALLAMEKEKLVVCLNPESKKERFYRLTPLGARVKRELGKLGH